MSDDTGRIEIDHSGAEPIVSIGHPPGPFTIDQLRSYAAYLGTVAEEAAKRPEPEIDELAAIIDASDGRWLAYPANIREIARAVLAAGYKREIAATEKAG